MAKIEETISALELKLKRAKALKQKNDTRKRTEDQKKARTAETRKKILAGAFMLERMARNPETKTRFLTQLDTYLTRADDRALFGLDTPAQIEPVASQSQPGPAFQEQPAALPAEPASTAPTQTSGV